MDSLEIWVRKSRSPFRWLEGSPEKGCEKCKGSLVPWKGKILEENVILGELIAAFH